MSSASIAASSNGSITGRTLASFRAIQTPQVMAPRRGCPVDGGPTYQRLRRSFQRRSTVGQRAVDKDRRSRDTLSVTNGGQLASRGISVKMDDLVSATLDDRIRYWLGRGFRLTTQTSTSASLSMRRRFNPAEFVVMPIYLIEWLGQREQTVYLAAVPDGRVRETATGMEQSAYRRMQEAPAWQRLVTVIVAVAIVLVVLWALNGARR